LFLQCKVFNTSVDKFVENRGATLLNFRRFNILERIAPFVCNIDASYAAKTATGPNRLPTSVSEMEFSAGRGNEMFHGMFHGTFQGVFAECFTECSSNVSQPQNKADAESYHASPSSEVNRWNKKARLPYSVLEEAKARNAFNICCSPEERP